MPASAGEVQIEETRRAFIAGAWCVFKGVVHVSENAKGDDDPAAMHFLDELNAELEAFAVDLVADKAVPSGEHKP
jgi:hypothetical protein